MRVRFKIFESMMMSWDTLFDEASQFASRLGPDRIISISHSDGGQSVGARGVVTVWYWDEDPDAR